MFYICKEFIFFIIDFVCVLVEIENGVFFFKIESF